MWCRGYKAQEKQSEEKLLLFSLVRCGGQ